jgi:predicted ferric reductase
MTKRTWGYAVIFAACLITIDLWYFAKPMPSVILNTPFRAAGQVCGLLGVVFLAAEYVLATRLKWVEKSFGGLDVAYKAHRILGATGFLLILYHPFFLAVSVLPSLTVARKYFLFSNDLAYNLGVTALYAYFALIAATMFVRLPYHVWKKTHIWMGAPFLIAIWHIVLIPSDVSRFMPLRIWILSLCAIATAAFLYRRFLYGRFSPKGEFTVAKIKQLKDTTEILLQPTGRNFAYLPGQFAFATFQSDGVDAEKHPFSFSSSPTDLLVRFSIKSLGDYTATLKRLVPGDHATLYGPHGAFGQFSLEAPNRAQIWIGGGIGITPFLSLLRYYAAAKKMPHITLFYVTKSTEDASYLTELQTLAAPLADSFTLVHHRSSEFGTITADVIKTKVGGTLDKRILLCGPPGMMDALSSQFVRQGVHPRSIHFEDFSFLS